MNNQSISGMIFAAGLGTRLYPLTAQKPKALVEIHRKTLLEIAIEKLIDAGIQNIVVNVHHFSEQIIYYLNHHSFDANISISDESTQLLDTAGGLKKAESYLKSEHVLLYNVDILSSINLRKMIQFHIERQVLATLAVKERETSRYFIFDKKTGQLAGWYHTKSGEKIISRQIQNAELYAFSGIHIIKKELFPFLLNSYKQSLTSVYLSLAAQYPILAYKHEEDDWMDVGKYDDVVKLVSQE